MARPALSASRGLDIIELLASAPQRGFTLSEIVNLAGINIASCHAILSLLTERGYLIRSPDQKSYVLGSALIAMGQVAVRSQPMVARAQRVAEDLLAELGVPVMLCTVAGEDILAVLSLEDETGGYAGMRVGERVPLVAPSGTPFLAWASEEAVDAWIARHTGPRDDALVAEWRRDLFLTRQRGYQVTMQSGGPSISSIMAEMASNRRVRDYKGEVQRLVNSLDHHMCQPEVIVEDAVYDVLLIASPLFDENGEATFNICLGGFPNKLTGAQLTAYAEKLVNACLQVMRVPRLRAGRR